MKKTILVITILSLALVSGCAAPKVKMYPGNEVEESQRAVIKADKQFSGRIDIYSVDGKKTSNYFATLAHGGNAAVEVYVLPGKHNITAQVRYLVSYAFVEMWLVAEAGESYVIKARSEGFSVTMWIENERTGKPVGGIKGSDDEPR